MEYLRIGTKYYRIINTPWPSNDGSIEYKKELVPWKRGAILDDYGKNFLKEQVSKFDNKYELTNDLLLLYNQL